MRRCRKSGPNHISTWPVAHLHIHRMNTLLGRNKGFRRFALQDRKSLLGTMCGCCTDDDCDRVANHLLVRHIDPQDFRMDGRLHALVDRHDASGSQEVRVGRLEVAGVRARGEAGDVDIEAQALATLKLQGSRAQGSLFTLRTGCSALFDLYLEPVRQDLRHFGHHLRIRLFGLLPKVRVQDLPRARQENHSRPIAVPSSEVAAHLQAHQPSTVENNGLGLLQCFATGPDFGNALRQAHPSCWSEQGAVLAACHDKDFVVEDRACVRALVHQGDLLLVTVYRFRWAQEVLHIGPLLHLPLLRVAGSPFHVLLRAVQKDGGCHGPLLEGVAVDVGNGLLAFRQDFYGVERAETGANYSNIERLCHGKCPLY
mmetsp:Transcript_137324/g.194308  ORF Transcript_137324/g.194308 Transcript_137324/m.194308 type:complete len:370 (-) Transcript_137324:39-1148(-)